MSSFHSVAEIDSLVTGLINRSLPKAEWTHAAHFAAALWLLQHEPERAMSEMGPIIIAYNEATGVPNTDTSGYHETITLASLRAAQSWLVKRRDVPLHAILAEMLTTPVGRSDWLFSYWSKSLLFSAKARRSWVDPDLAPLPF
jgi:hypothetical protein